MLRLAMAFPWFSSYRLYFYTLTADMVPTSEQTLFYRLTYLVFTIMMAMALLGLLQRLLRGPSLL